MVGARSYAISVAIVCIPFLVVHVSCRGFLLPLVVEMTHFSGGRLADGDLNLLHGHDPHALCARPLSLEHDIKC